MATKTLCGIRDTHQKWICGPGGIDCPCCRKGTKAEVKRGNARGKRRKARMECAQTTKGADYLTRSGFLVED